MEKATGCHGGLVGARPAEAAGMASHLSYDARFAVILFEYCGFETREAIPLYEPFQGLSDTGVTIR
jgi:hypothetical protein